jgi:Flp pilus assembly protein TadD
VTQTPADPFQDVLARLRGASRHEALVLLGDAADQYPRDPRPLLLLAAEFAHGKDLDRAEAAYLGALQRAPDFAIARFQLGLLQLTSGRPAAAQATWAPLDALAADDPLRLFKQGLEALSQDRFAAAREHILQGISRNTANPPLNRDMQKVLDRMTQAGVIDARDPGAGRAAVAPEAGGHVLVSNYGRKA